MSRDYEAVRQEIWRWAQADRSRDEALAAGMANMMAFVADHEAERAPWGWVERVWALGGMAFWLFLYRKRLWRRFMARCWAAAPVEVAVEGPEEPDVEMGSGAPEAERPVEEAAAVLRPVQQVPGWGASVRGWLRGPQPAPSVPADGGDAV